GAGPASRSANDAGGAPAPDPPASRRGPARRPGALPSTSRRLVKMTTPERPAEGLRHPCGHLIFLGMRRWPPPPSGGAVSRQVVRLEIATSDGFTKVVLIDRSPFLIGSDPSADLPLGLPGVAPRHAQIVRL